MTYDRLPQNVPLHLDSPHPQSNFIRAAFQPPCVGSAHPSRDTSLVYRVMRRRDLAQALLPVVSAPAAPAGPNAVEGLPQ
ncbi:DUF3438 family protein [Pseudomonas sp. RHF3.3-3]|uniref:Uncharacterized protein n=1 Tax=Pseudomonas asplenii TaxID=53407 RepID=A0A0N0E3Q6_9PSED|nr:DUF3438 family protein [Pseudomonas fuscovaginae]KPA90359.1 Protein of unknown function (DUF3438) [Pseudomonas fuscovaginae]